MIIHLAKEASAKDRQEVLDRILSAGLKYDLSHGATGIELIGVLGDTSRIEESQFLELNGVALGQASNTG